MRSYQSHLESIQNKEAVTRASSLFPVLREKGCTTHLLFLGYWLLKRGIKKVEMRLTERDIEGKILKQQTHLIDQPKAYSFAIESPGAASAEAEFTSEVPLVFPYPAVSVLFSGPHFATFVHTAQRTFNNSEDEQKNCTYEVAESGFNLLQKGESEPFVTLINGARQAEGSTCTIGDNHFPLPRKPYECAWIYPEPAQELSSVKVRAALAGVYPRLIVGNRLQDRTAYSITHSYYDCSGESDETSYWQPPKEPWHQATLALPLLRETKATFYPIYSPANFAIDIEFFDAEGTLLQKIPDALAIDSSFKNLQRLPLTELAPSAASTARLIARGKKIPARIKIGYDIEGKGLPLNICTNLQPFIPSWDNKPFTFKWAPLIAHKQGRSSIYVVNSSQHKNYRREAKITVTLYREKDRETKSWQLTLPPHGSTQIQRAEHADFLEGKTGWLTATSENPHITTYSFIEMERGHLGGDHGF